MDVKDAVIRVWERKIGDPLTIALEDVEQGDSEVESLIFSPKPELVKIGAAAILRMHDYHQMGLCRLKSDQKPVYHTTVATWSPAFRGEARLWWYERRVNYPAADMRVVAFLDEIRYVVGDPELRIDSETAYNSKGERVYTSFSLGKDSANWHGDYALGLGRFVVTAPRPRSLSIGFKGSGLVLNVTATLDYSVEVAE